HAQTGGANRKELAPLLQLRRVVSVEKFGTAEASSEIPNEVRDPYRSRERSRMRTFEEWWQDVIVILDHPREIRNWTAHNGYTVGGQFHARSYRSLSREERSAWNYGYPFSSPNDWIICTQVKGEGVATVSKKEFRDRYGRWPAYRDNKIIRKDF